MLFSVARYISRMSRYVTLYPDDHLVRLWWADRAHAERRRPGRGSQRCNRRARQRSEEISV